MCHLSGIEPEERGTACSEKERTRERERQRQMARHSRMHIVLQVQEGVALERLRVLHIERGSATHRNRAQGVGREAPATKLGRVTATSHVDGVSRGLLRGARGGGVAGGGERCPTCDRVFLNARALEQHRGGQ